MCTSSIDAILTCVMNLHCSGWISIAPNALSSFLMTVDLQYNVSVRINCHIEKQRETNNIFPKLTYRVISWTGSDDLLVSLTGKSARQRTLLTSVCDTTSTLTTGKRHLPGRCIYSALPARAPSFHPVINHWKYEN